MRSGVRAGPPVDFASSVREASTRAALRALLCLERRASRCWYQRSALERSVVFIRKDDSPGVVARFPRENVDCRLVDCTGTVDVDITALN